jgi:hypothetical protein
MLPLFTELLLLAKLLLVLRLLLTELLPRLLLLLFRLLLLLAAGAVAGSQLGLLMLLSGLPLNAAGISTAACLADTLAAAVPAGRAIV